jgi:hypothetical protein
MTGVKIEDSKTPQVIVFESAKTEADNAAGSPKKSGVMKKRVIVAVACVLTVAIVVAGILVGVKFFLDSTNDIVKKTLEFAVDSSDSKVKQNVTTDVTNNIAEYHLEQDDREIWVVQDFSRDISVMKVRTTDGDVCFVTPLNDTDTTVQDIRNATASSDPVETVRTKYIISEKPIKDKSVLGTAGQKLCSTANTYWMIPVCDAASSSDGNGTLTSGRQKRWGISCGIDFCYICISHWKIKKCCTTLVKSFNVSCVNGCISIAGIKLICDYGCNISLNVCQLAFNYIKILILAYFGF